MAAQAARAAEEKKAEDVLVLDVGRLTPLADYFVICSGRSRIQVQAIADAVRETLAGLGKPLRHIEGYEGGRWVLLDYGDVVVHVFLAEERQYYQIERLWRDAPRCDWTAAPEGERGR